MANQALVGAPLSATGGVLSAPEGTALPTSATAVTTGFVALGLIGEDGLSETADRSTDQIRAWGGSLARTVQIEYGLSYTFQFITTNKAVLEEVHGVDNVTVTPGVDPAFDELAIAVNNKQLPVKPYMFEVKDGDNRIRIVIPNGQITAVGGVTYSHNDIIRREVTLTCYADESGNEAYLYITGPAVSDAA
jgi:hypothetical protein